VSDPHLNANRHINPTFTGSNPSVQVPFTLDASVQVPITLNAPDQVPTTFNHSDVVPTTFNPINLGSSTLDPPTLVTQALNSTINATNTSNPQDFVSNTPSTLQNTSLLTNPSDSSDIEIVYAPPIANQQQVTNPKVQNPSKSRKRHQSTQKYSNYHHILKVNNVFNIRLTTTNFNLESDQWIKNYIKKFKKMFEKCEICKLDGLQHRVHCQHRRIDFEMLKDTGIYYCDLDGYMSKNRHNIQLHMKSHVMVKCPICGNVMKQRGLNLHIKNYHEDVGEYKCDKCQKIFKTEGLLKKHYPSHESKYECKFCGQRFLKKSILTEHFNGHHNEISSSATSSDA
jgi:DNA-directed RNA polymerase subunit RPC12/RpoP